MKRVIPLVLIAFVLLIGCEDAEPPVQATATSQPIVQVIPTVEPTATAEPTATIAPTATDTPIPTETPIPEPTSTPIPEPTATATATPIPPTSTPTPVPLGTSRYNPAPIGPDGALISDDGFLMGVGAAIQNVADAETLTEAILAANPYNDPPPEGHLFFNVGIVVTNLSTESRTFYAGRFHLVGQSNVAYSQFQNSCGVLPDDIPVFDSYREMFEGGTVSGFICFAVKESDIGTLVLFDDGPTFSLIEHQRLFWEMSN